MWHFVIHFLYSVCPLVIISEDVTWKFRWFLSEYLNNIRLIAHLNKSSDDINPSDVTVAYMSEINKSKTIKYLGYLWLDCILLMGRHKEDHNFSVIEHDIQVTVMVRWLAYVICVWHKLCHKRWRWRSIIINIVQQSTNTHQYPS